MDNENARKKVTLKPWHGVVWFIIVMVVMFFGGGLVQLHFGMLGLAITEIGLAVLGLLPLLLFDVRLKDMLPIKIPKVRHVFGTILMWIGAFMLSILATLVIGYFFPQDMGQTSTAMGGFMTSVPPVLAFFIVAVMPPICEEILHRGFILTSMRSIKKDWLIVLIMGLIFGIFHLDPMRFAATAILGAALTYVMLKTKNFLLPFLMHLIQNSLSIIVTFATKDDLQVIDTVNTEVIQNQLSSITTIGAWLVLGAAIPVLIFLGSYLLTKKDKHSEDTAVAKTSKKPIIAFLISLGLGAVMFVSGIVILVVGSLGDAVYIVKPSLSINDDTTPYVETFTVEKEKLFTMSYSLRSEIGAIEMTIRDEQGNVLYDVAAGEITGNGQLALKEGTYTATFRFLIGEYEDYALEKGYPYTDEEKAVLHLDGDLDADYPAAVTLVLM